MIERVYSRESTIKEQVVIKGDYNEEEAQALANAALGEGVSEVARYPQPAHLISFSRPELPKGFTPAEEPAAAPVEAQLEPRELAPGEVLEEVPYFAGADAVTSAKLQQYVDQLAEVKAEAEAERAAEAAELAVVPVEEAFSGVAPVEHE